MEKLSPEGLKTSNSLENEGTFKTTYLRNSSAGQLSLKRRSKALVEKKIADDEYMAAAIGDVDWLRQSLRDIGGQINYDKNGLTALHLAAIHGRLDCIKLCINKFKFDINLPSTTGWRAVHLAISNQTGKRSIICLNYLLENGADPSICNDDKISPVHQAASEGHVKCLKLLIERGAKVDVRDCRKNSPLDLAKLWGHRKCARILAAEMWHRDKREIYRDMLNLNKFRMQQVLWELDEEEELRAAREMYGDEAFKQWLQMKQLEERSTGPFDSMYKGNSKLLDNLLNKLSPSKTFRVDESIKRVDDNSILIRGDKSDSADGKVVVPKIPLFVNRNRWLYSKRFPELDYMTHLKDEYPRDEFTMMPKTEGSHKYFDGKHLGDNQMFDYVKDPHERRAHTPRDIFERSLVTDPTLQERPVYFKPKFIPDVLTKRKCHDPDLHHKSEAPLHMYTDVNCDLVRNALRISVKPVSAPISKPSFSDQTSSQSVLDNFPNSMVLSAMKQMSTPTHFPNIKGSEYVLNLKNLRV